MNLRILKKLSKRTTPPLPLLGDDLQQRGLLARLSARTSNVRVDVALRLDLINHASEYTWSRVNGLPVISTWPATTAWNKEKAHARLVAKLARQASIHFICESVGGNDRLRHGYLLVTPSAILA